MSRNYRRDAPPKKFQLTPLNCCEHSKRGWLFVCVCVWVSEGVGVSVLNFPKSWTLWLPCCKETVGRCFILGGGGGRWQSLRECSLLSNFPGTLWGVCYVEKLRSFLQFWTAINSIRDAICVGDAIKCVFWAAVICGINRWLSNVS